MRHLLALFALAFALVACDDTATTAPTDTIPGPPDAPRLSVTVLTGTKAAPVDSPTVKVQWWYKESVNIAGSGIGDSLYSIVDGSTTIIFQHNASGDSTVKVGCAGKNNIKYMIAAQGSGKYSVDTIQVYCKAP